MIRAVAIVLILVVAVSGCGSTTPSGTLVHSCGGGNASGSMSANISGTNFTATCLLTITSTAGIVSVGATNVSGNNATGFIDLTFAVVTTTTGTFSFAASPGAPNPNNAAVSIGGSQIWQAGAGTAGASGTVTITTLPANHVAGTFSFTMVAAPGATGTKTVSNGKFDITF